MFCPVYTVADKFLSGYARSPRDQDSSVARILVRGGHTIVGRSGAWPPEMFWILGLWNGIFCILRAHLSVIYRFEIPVCLVKKMFGHSQGGHGRMSPPLNTLLDQGRLTSNIPQSELIVKKKSSLMNTGWVLITRHPVFMRTIRKFYVLRLKSRNL